MKMRSVEHELQQVARRFRWRTMWQSLTAVWMIALVVAWAMFIYTRANGQPWPARTLALSTLVIAWIVMAVSLLRRVDLRQIAHEIERRYPELETKLLAAFEQEQQTPAGRRGYLETAVIHQAQHHARTHQLWRPTVPTRDLLSWYGAQALALFSLCATLILAPLRWPATDVPAAVDESVAVAIPASEMPTFEVEPGDVELERGSDLLVLARFADRAKLPRELSLLVAGAEGEKPHAMQQSLSDPIFAGRVAEVRQDLSYQLALGAERSPKYRVTVFDYPELERADADLRYPSYTGLTPRKIEDVRQFSAIEGTELRWLCRLNKPVASAKLVPAEGEPLVLEASTDDKTLYVASRTLTQSERWKLELVDDRGRKNRQSVDLVVTVLPNRAPELKLIFPRQDVKVSPLQEVSLEAEVSDDFGVVQWGMSYELVGKKTESKVLGEKLPALEKHSGRQVVSLEDLKAKPDELLTWHVWAEDLGPDGKVRRTTSDIYFAEVSPFEEIFREQSSDGGEGEPGQPNPADEGIKLQKEIIAATWNVRRREQADALSTNYGDDVQAIADAQQKAIDQLAEMREKLKSPEAIATVAEVEKHMQAAHRALATAATGKTLPPLDDALPAEQAAYQALLRLRAKESRVSRSRNAKGGGGQQSAAGQNLDQLELSNEDERYESQKRAGEAKQTPAEREREEFLGRLRELARRQEDMNQKIKELQAALDAARNEEEKKAIERQLKRLRDEQRDMLRDIDQLKNQFDQPKHNQPLAEASKQLDATRENVREASDALDKGQTPQALAAGTRAESGLDKMREDFRKQTAGQYTEEVRDLVDRARKLDERQQRIASQLTPEKAQPKGSLRSSPTETKSELPKELGEQRKELDEVLDQARKLTERAEGNEPLLTKQLYDTLRATHQNQTARAVEMMQQLVEHGLNSEATKVEPRAQEGVKKLRAGIEKAAESVLGNDVEGLRRAKQEVDRLVQALAEEIRRENPSNAPPREEQGDAAKSQASGEASKGEQGKGEQGKGESTDAKSSDSKSSNSKSENLKSQNLKSENLKSRDSKSGNQPGQGQPQPNGQPSRGQPGKGQSQDAAQPQANGQSNEGKPGNNQPGQPQPGNNQPNPSQPGSTQPGNDRTAARSQTGTGALSGALEGPDWRQWSDALRNVEEFVPGTRLRTAAADVREQALALRAEAKRHSKNPNWDLVREKVYEPLVELQRELNEELLRRTSPEAVVPLDRDPVPDRFTDAVRRYYERLGKGQ